MGKLALMDEAPNLVYTSPVKRLYRSKLFSPKSMSSPNLEIESKRKCIIPTNDDNDQTTSTTIDDSTLKDVAPLEDEVYQAVAAGSVAAGSEPPLVPEVIDVPDEISYGELQKMSQKASSIPNFAKLLAERMFSMEELKSSNMSGSRGKNKLDENRTNKLRSMIFELYTMSNSQEQIVWKKCRDAINEFCRRK